MSVDRRPEVLVRSYMTGSPATLPSGSSVSEARRLFEARKVRHVPVVDSKRRPLGILSDRDVRPWRAETGVDLEDVTVDEVMTPDPYRVLAHSPVSEAAAVMADRKYGCAVVVEDEQVVGIFTTTDALRALVKLG